MRVKLDDDLTPGIEMSPLIDCVFLLLIFFLVATTLKKPEEIQQNIPVEEQSEQQIIEEFFIELPEPAISAGYSTDKGPLVISIDADGDFYYDKTHVDRKAMLSKLREVAGIDPETHIRIDVDRYADSQYLIQILDLCAYEGLKNYGIHTQNKIE